MVDTPKKRRITKKDFNSAAEYIADELARRKRRRTHREEMWADIDRQIRMEAKPTNRDKHGNIIPDTEWMPFVEPPFQAQTLELLNADARRLMFPTDRNYFSAHTNVDSDFLQSFEAQLPAITGDRGNATVAQDDIDKIVEGAHQHFQDQYDYRNVWDLLNGEAFKYGEFVGRAELRKREKFSNEYRGIVRKNQKIPMLTARSIKNTYPDDNPRGMEITPSTIFTYRTRLDDLAVAATGPKDPTNPNGGWIPNALKNLSGDDNGFVTVMEYEGDMIIPRSGASLFFPNVIVTAVSGRHESQGVTKIVRWRENQLPFHSYLHGTYHSDDLASPSSPLMKGHPVQLAAAQSLSRLLQAAILNTEPPVQYDSNDTFFAKNGGPRIYPRALWETFGAVKPVEIGDVGALTNVYLEFVRQYQEVTGASPPRLGAQTKSHQTAFAVDSELERGVIRTVDYVRSVNYGPMRTWLSMEYELIKQVLKEPQDIYVPEFKMFLSIDNQALPERVTYDVHGVAGPLEERQQQQRQIEVIQQLVQVEQIAVQSGAQPLNWDELRRGIAEEAFDDAAKLFVARQQANPGAAPGGQGLPQDDEGSSGQLPQLAAVAG